MSMELIEKIISDISLIPVNHRIEVVPNKVNEPLADKRIFKILDLIKNKIPNTRIYFVTNGSLLSKEALVNLSQHNISKLCTSLNFFDKDCYERNMGLSYKKTINNLNTLREMHRCNTIKFPVHISRVKNNTNYDHDFEGWIKENYPEFKCWMKNPGEWLNHIKKWNQSDIQLKHGRCGQWSNFSITSTGDVAFCCMDAEAEYSWANVKNASIIDIFNQTKWGRIRSNRTSMHDITPCKTCTY
jgi:radical SAM protein with 4Fe4S-binding SPASM domain